MNPSKMTDEQLRLAIAEELGWTRIKKLSGDLLFHLSGRIVGLPLGVDYNEGRGLKRVPNYPGDTAAAMGLLEEFEYWVVQSIDGLQSCLIYKSRHNWAHQEVALACGEGDSLSRAICEAWLTARRNDGDN